MKGLKLTLIVIVTGLLFASTLQAEIGIKLGVNGSRLRDMGTVMGTNETMKNLLGFEGGVFVSLPIVPHILYLQPEALWVQRGGKLNLPQTGTIQQRETRYKLNYIEIPVLLKVKFPGVVAPYILAGGYGAFKMSSKRVIKVSGTQTEDIKIKTNLKNMDWGLVGGVGVDFKIGMAKILIEGRYEVGLTKIFKTDADIFVPPTTAEIGKNSRIVGMIGIAL
ncbi:MAG: porin family protein [Candidatus Omnitrophota bacterium]